MSTINQMIINYNKIISYFYKIHFWDLRKITFRIVIKLLDDGKGTVTEM